MMSLFDGPVWIYRRSEETLDGGHRLLRLTKLHEAPNLRAAAECMLSVWAGEPGLRPYRVWPTLGNDPAHPPMMPIDRGEFGLMLASIIYGDNVARDYREGEELS